LELSSDSKGSGATKSDDNESLYYLDIKKPSIVQPLHPRNMEQGRAYKFVQVEVAKVVNPKKYPYVPSALSIES
jgi:hypothetical protein